MAEREQIAGSEIGTVTVRGQAGNIPTSSTWWTPARWQQIRTDIGVPLAAFIFSRAALLLIGWFTLTFIAHDSQAPDVHQIYGLACRWDCGWYLSIAQHGYLITSPAAQPDATNLAFWPAFPFAARYLSEVTGLTILAAGTLLSNSAFVLCLVLLRKYCLKIGLNEQTSAFAVFLLAFAPQSYVFSGFYTESFCLLGVVGSIYCARNGRWWTSGLFGILATLSRPTGILLLVYLIAHAYQEVGWKGFLKPWKDVLPFVPVVLTPAGELAALAIAYHVSGDAFAQAHTAVAGWGVKFEAPWAAVYTHLTSSPHDFFLTASALALSLSLIPIFHARLFQDAIFAAVAILFLLSNTIDQSILRYILIIPPVFIGIALASDRIQWLRQVVFGIFAMLGAAFFCAWTLGLIISV